MDGELATKTVPVVQSNDRNLSKGERTRARILDLAFDSVIAKGFAATSIEELVEAAGITKSGFFYHFRDKTDLARQLLERYQAEDDELTNQLVDRARELSDDPLHSLLIFLKLYAEMLTEIVAQHPGCIVATVTFQEASFDREVSRINAEGIVSWRERLAAWLGEIAQVYPPRTDINLDDLADNLTAVTIGAIVLTKAVRDPEAVGRQTLIYRDFIRLLFAR